MNHLENTKALQRFAGTVADGIFGPDTSAALVAKLGLASEAHAPPTPAARPKLKVCLDPGHGMANRRAGTYDPGCVRGELHEADIVLDYARAIGAELQALGVGVTVFFTRRDNTRPTPLGTRAALAEDAGCDLFVSIHVNDADGKPTGTETFYTGTDDEPLAARCQAAMLKGLGLRDRGIKQTGSLTVLKFRGPAVLLELGFIGADAASLTDKTKIAATAKLLAQAIATP
jgi:N-acetylmuramoyl-L-alanine amidase